MCEYIPLAPRTPLVREHALKTTYLTEPHSEDV